MTNDLEPRTRILVHTPAIYGLERSLNRDFNWECFDTWFDEDYDRGAAQPVIDFYCPRPTTGHTKYPNYAGFVQDNIASGFDANVWTIELARKEMDSPVPDHTHQTMAADLKDFVTEAYPYERVIVLSGKQMIPGDVAPGKSVLGYFPNQIIERLEENRLFDGREMPNWLEIKPINALFLHLKK